MASLAPLIIIAAAIVAGSGAASATEDPGGGTAAGWSDPGARDAAESTGAVEPPTTTRLRRETRDFLAARDAPRRDRPQRPAAARARAGTPETELLGANRVVSLYGAPQLSRTILGRKSLPKAAGKLRRQASGYEVEGRVPVIPAFDVIATIATADRGADGLYRFRQSSRVLDAYQTRATRLGGRLVLDIQPGRADVLDEVRALRSRILAPNVDVAIDPEWNVGRRGVPGRSEGSISARKLNRVSALLQEWVDRYELPPKLLVVHQFHERSVRYRERVLMRPGVEVALNFDGIGSPPAKRAGYAALGAEQLHDGFSLFYRLDSRLMAPRKVMRLQPSARYVMYQ